MYYSYAMGMNEEIYELEKEGFLSNCPNCGAAISQIEFGKCQYCESIILPIRYNWVLVKFEMV